MMSPYELAKWLVRWFENNVTYVQSFDGELDDVCVDGYVDFIGLAHELKDKLDV